MNSKKINRLFLFIILIHFAAEVLLILAAGFLQYHMGIITNYIVSEAIVVIPTIVYVLMAKENPVRLAGFHRIRWSSAAMTILFTLLCMPLITLMNLLSLLFVENTAVSMSGSMLEQPFGVTFFFLAVSAPICEEFVCRGVMLQGYCKSGSVLKAALLSGLIFALIHLNFNQASYAFVMGVITALLVQVAGSIWPAILFHGILNGSQVCSMYLVNHISTEIYTDTAAVGATLQQLLLSLTVYLFLAAVTTPLAWAVLVWLGKNEQREHVLSEVWQNRGMKKDKMITASFVIALILCVIYMVITVVLTA